MGARIDRTIQDTYNTRLENLNGLEYQEKPIKNANFVIQKI